jgi:putative oxidoreductase
MTQLLAPYLPHLYTALRIVAGLLFAQHGAQKLFGVIGGTGPVDLASMMGVAGVVELVGGVSIAVGLFTSLWAFLASGQMAVAYVMAHAGQSLWPVQNGGELAALYAFLFLYIAARGTGRWGLRP